MADDAPDIQQPASDVLAIQNAVTAAGQSQQPQQQNRVPTPTPGMPALFELGKQLINPTQQVPSSASQQPSRPSRLDAFEHFLGNFVTSLAAGFQTPPGPGANMRAAGAAMTAPYQQNVQRFQLQQQANTAQAQQQLAGAETQRATVEAQLAPQQLQLNQQIKTLQLQMEENWKQATISQGQQKIDLGKVREQFSEQIKSQTLDLDKRYKAGQLNVAQEIARYRGMDTASQVSYRQAMAQATVTKLAQAQQALGLATTLKTAQALKTATEASNQYSVFARLARSIGLEDDLGMPLPELNVPGIAVGGGNGAPPANTIPPATPPKGDKVGSLVNKYK
jgi:hypothetical protein